MSTEPMTAPAEFAEVEANWRPEPYEISEFVTLSPCAALSGLFDTEPAATGVGDPLPPLWHWLYLLDRPAQADLGADGHTRDGHFVPPLANRRRLFGGGRATFHQPLRVGDLATRRSRVARVRVRYGSTGWLLIVTVRHEIYANEELCVTEEQDLVHRESGAEPLTALAAHSPAVPEQQPSPWALQLVPDATMLFRFSALSYNAHRPHYDLDYARAAGHPGLVVHGPLIALALAELPRRFAPGRTVSSFTYRCSRLLHAPDPVRLRGGSEENGEVLVGAAQAPAGQSASGRLRFTD